MGCGSSHEVLNEKGQGVRRRPELTRSDPEDSLREVAHILAGQRLQARIVIVGGAVNTLYLGGREHTCDVNIVGGFSSKQQKMALEQAIRKLSQTKSNLHPNWINFKGLQFVTPEKRSKLMEETFKQNVVVFEAYGLMIYAAPWRFAFASKVSRLCKAAGGQARSAGPARDAKDAAQYLHQFMQSKGLSWIDDAEIRSWCQNFGFDVGGSFVEAMKTINAFYERSFGTKPIRGKRRS